ncbi:MAG TPA: ArsA-related P-loop ATPase [Polyangiaceae bacterium]|nr:ArsA-related P-loop ATPase [Polyangiaceae bacterium]
MGTRLSVCVGGGGVGKTTTSAALALSLAQRKRKTLVITVDPARRLADALGTEVGRHAQPVTLDRAGGMLFARMPDSRMSLDDFVLWLFEDPVQRQRVMNNPAYRELGDSLAGVHELITIGLLQTEIDSGHWDEVVLDTAPSRHALAFLTYPSRLLGLLEAKALAWLAALASTADPSQAEHKPKSGLFEWGRSKAEAIMGKIVGLDGLRNLSALFADMVSVRERWAGLARRTDHLLRNPSTRYLIIGAPTGGAMADAAFLVDNLGRNGLKPSAIVLNRAESEPPLCEQRVMQAISDALFDVPEQHLLALRNTLETMQNEHQLRGQAATRTMSALQDIAPAGTRVLRLPFIHRSEPSAIVIALADAWLATGSDL